MPRFAANLGMLFTERPLLERFGAAAMAGFRAVEHGNPYDVPAEEIAERLKQHGLQQCLINLPAGNWHAGERGIACIPGREEEFRASVAKGLHYAKVLGAPLVNCLAGFKPEGLAQDEAFDTLVGNLIYAAEQFEGSGITLIVEAINPKDMPGFFLNTSRDALAAIDATGRKDIKFQYDIYHMQRVEGELAATIERLMPRIAHFQIAGNPRRTEPDQGEINYPYLLKLIDDLGYRGWIGAEYKPVAGTEAGLAWLKRWST